MHPLDREEKPRVPDDEPPVVVCGAGAAGLAASLAAARCGRDVWLVEAAERLGGTVTGALIHTLGGLFDSHGEFVNDGLPRELADRLSQADECVRKRRMGRTWVLNVCPSVYRRVVERWLAEHPRIRVCTGCRPVEVIVEGGLVTGVEIAGGRRHPWLWPRGVVDATGTAELVRLIDPRLVERDDRPAAGSVIFRLRGVTPGTLEFPHGLGVVRSLRSAAETGLLPAECTRAWLDSGVYPDEAFVKLFAPVPARPPEAGHYERVRDQVIEFLRSLPGFEQARLTETGQLGVRDGGRIRGEYRLMVDDVRSGRRFADAIGRCAWPIEFWDPDEGVSIEYMPEGTSYDVPLRSLAVRGFENLWAAGKCLSAEPLAQASARVVGTCWAMGEAAGRAAAMSEAPNLKHQITNKSQIPIRKPDMFNLDELFRQTASRQPDSLAMLRASPSERLTYRQLSERIDHVASRLAGAGVQRGETVGLHCPSGLDYIVFNYAVWRCGGCAVPIPVELAVDEKREIGRRIALRHIITARSGLPALDVATSARPVPLEGETVVVPAAHRRDHPPGFESVNAAFIRFTSGTTGTSKGVVLSHETIAARIAAANEVLALGPRDRVVWLLSMSYHFAVSIVAYLSYGAAIVLPRNNFAASVLAAIRDCEGTLVYGSPVHYTWMADSGERGPMSGVRLALSTTTSLNVETARQFHERFGLPLTQALGIIEIGLPAINVDFAADRPEAVGRVLPAYELRLEDAGLDSRLRHVLLRGPGFLDAYYDPWQPRDAIMPDGWFRTGDVGELDADGCLFLRGRAKDVIDVMGMKFFPQEVESVLLAHPRVEAACVVPRPHVRLGEAPHAKVVVKPDPGGSLTGEELRDFCQQRLAAFKVPEEFEFVEALEQTPSGKLLHRTTG
ncbi:MAG TPA: FAD-dependent oxidoreductase [Planctomycetaceae bacterium]|nr:FAD-dependent oxidoreductase [Planctomycetaceae bacterium]